MSYRYDDFVPDEWRSALRSGHRLFGIIHKTRAPVKKHLVGFGLPLALGVIYYVFVRPTFSAFAISASMTVIGLLAGFLINLMLTLGKSDTLESVDYATSRLVIDRLRYLLWSLTATFLSYVATLAVGIALLAMTVPAGKTEPAPVPIFTALFVSGLMLVFIRSVFLPLQIVELHQLQFDQILRAKQRRQEQDLASRRQEAKGKSGA